MNVVSIVGLDAAYRVYQTSAGFHARVKVIPSENELSKDCACFFIAAQPCDAVTGEEAGPAIKPSYFQLDLTELAKPVFSDETVLPPNPVGGQLVRLSDELYQFSDTEQIWINRGPIAADANESVAEFLAWWDAVAREQVLKAEAAHQRLSAMNDINTLIGLAV